MKRALGIRSFASLQAGRCILGNGFFGAGRKMLLGLLLMQLATPAGFAQTVYRVTQSALSSTFAVDSTPVTISGSGDGYGYTGAVWNAYASAQPGSLALSVYGSGNPNPFNGAGGSAKMMADAVFTDVGGAPTVSVSLNSILDGFFGESGAWQTDFVARVGILGSSFESGVRRNNLGVQYVLSDMGTFTGPNVDDLLLVTPSVLVPTNAPIPIFLYIESQNTLSNGVASINNTDFTYSLPIGSPVFNLAAGVTVQVAAWSVVNNQITAVPEPAATPLVVGVITLLGFVRWRRMSRG